MQKIKAIIIDDESRARELLRNLLTEFCKDVAVIEECSDLPSGVKAIRKQKPDLIFLDIEMPGHSGIELLDFFNEDEINFSIIFTTAYSQYALDAIKLSAFDYILKPIEPEELEKAIARYKKKTEQKPLKSVYNAQHEKIAIPTSNGLKFIEPETIVYIKADNSYSEVYTKDGNMIVVSRTLKNFEEALVQFPAFFRCNKSYIVNTVYVSDYVKSDGGYLVVNGKINIPIAADKVSEFIEKSSMVKR